MWLTSRVLTSSPFLERDPSVATVRNLNHVSFLFKAHYYNSDLFRGKTEDLVGKVDTRTEIKVKNKETV